MPTYRCKVEAEVEADSEEQALEKISQWNIGRNEWAIAEAGKECGDPEDLPYRIYAEFTVNATTRSQAQLLAACILGHAKDLELEAVENFELGLDVEPEEEEDNEEN